MLKNVLRIQGIEILNKEKKISVKGGFDMKDYITCFHFCAGACSGNGVCYEDGLPPDWPNLP